MRVLVDTSIWSLSLRREKAQDNVFNRELSILINDFKVEIIGPIRQEILSGIKHKSQFEILREYLSAFDDLEIKTHDYERAAEFYNLCRFKGIQGSNTDFLICAVAERNSLLIFTNDKDFEFYAGVLPIELYKMKL